MSVQPPPTRQQPHLLARPSHGLLARHGWLWLAAPGGGLLIVGIVVSGLIGSSSDAQHGTAALTTGFGLIIALALLVIGLPVRALVVRRHRRDWAPDAPLPTLGGRYRAPTGGGVALDALPHTVAPKRHLVMGTVLTLFLLGIIGGLLALAISGLSNGIHAMVLQHSSNTVRLEATLDQDTYVYHGRGNSYTDYVSYVVDGKAEHGVEISVDGSQPAGATDTILVDPSDPGDPVAASDHGWEDLIGGSIAALILLLFGSLWLAELMRHHRHPETVKFRRFSRR